MNKSCDARFLNGQAAALSIKDTGPSRPTPARHEQDHQAALQGIPATAFCACRAHAVRPYGEPGAARAGAGGWRASRKKSALTIVATPSVQNAMV